MDPNFWTPDRVRAVLICVGLLALVAPFFAYVMYRFAQEDRCRECGSLWTSIVEHPSELVRRCSRCGSEVILRYPR